MILRYIFITFFTVLIVLACNKKQEQPKVIYETPAQTKIESKIDTTQIKIADLPIAMEGTPFLIHPIGDVRIYDGRSKSSYGSSSAGMVSYSVSNYNRFEITGYLHNLHFQHKDSVSYTPLTDAKVIIQTATYLNAIADKIKKQLMIYTLADQDTNRDGKIDANDIKSLYISTIAGTRFTKLTPDFQELVDWNLIEFQNRIYFRTIEDTNKNGEFDKHDQMRYFFLDLTADAWEIVAYKPF
jgi:hypothetical protein